MRWFFFCLAILCVSIFIISIYDAKSQSWRTASRVSVGIAPDPEINTEAIIQVYGARAFSWRGYFGIHTWIAAKSTGAADFTIYEVIGWRLRSKQTALVSHQNPPDRLWYGNTPRVLAEKRGQGVDALIVRLEKIVNEYPYTMQYKVWPGPNSNTFTAWVSRFMPELELDLPPTAIGKDYIADSITSSAPSGTGFQFSIYGLFGVLASEVEGVEINLFGLVFGIGINPLAVKLPIIGRVNFPSQKQEIF